MKEAAIIISLAWRNVWRNPRRTILTMLTIIIGTAMILFLNAIATGGHDQMIDDAVAANTGHIQIHEKGYWENQTLEYAIKPDMVSLDVLKDDPRIQGISKRVQNAGLLSYRNKTTGVIIQGIEPGQESMVSDLAAKVLPGGRFLKDSDRLKVVMGEICAKNLGAGVGSEISMISQGFDGSIAADKFIIVGLFRSGNPEYDRSLMLMPIDQAKDTFTMMGFINTIVIRLKAAQYTKEIKSIIVEAHKSHDANLEIMTWDEMMPELVQFIVMDDVSAYIFDFILFMVVAFGILNTIQMAVFERTRELGVMLSIGTRPERIKAMVLVESGIITCIGLVLGLILGSSISYYFQLNPIDYSAYAEEIKVWGISTTIYPARLTVLNLTVTGILIFVLSIIFSWFPARRASKLNPIQAIRQL